MRFARITYLVAGIYGLLLITPLYFLEQQIGLEMPPAITHPEYFYGFVSVTLAWQVLFLLLARDPVRYRPLMLPTLLEKFPYGIAVIILFAQQRVSGVVLVFGLIDLTLGVLFLMAYLKTGAAQSHVSAPAVTRQAAAH
ncbi:MAG: hypothetical protein DCC55_40005 [Chloroflexi bacterium]|nr:MAG: hypothetical protein DCC55_40005 [Chloroflexota bacterium]